MLKPVLYGAAFLVAMSVPATAAGVQIGTAKGHCEKSALSGKPTACTALVYMHVESSGRTSLQFVTEEDVIAFSALETSQPKPEEFNLTIDAMTIQKRRVAASGKCRLQLSTDATFFQQALCTADFKGGKAEFLFKSDGSPVSRLDM